MTDKTNVELTSAYLRKIADEANRKKNICFAKTVCQCVADNVDVIDNLLIAYAKEGKYEMYSPINICDEKYTNNIGEFDICEFEDAVIQNLKSIYVEKGFKVPNIQGNYFKLGWK